MPLSRDLARQINAVASQDKELRRRVATVNWVFIPNHLGITGMVRNAGFWLRHKGDPDPVADRVCTGIAEAGMTAITSRLAELPEVDHANTISRVSWGVHHTATLVVLKGGQGRYVFDWHRALDVNDPFVGEERAWLVDKDQINLGRFRGLK